LYRCVKKIPGVFLRVVLPFIEREALRLACPSVEVVAIPRAIHAADAYRHGEPLQRAAIRRRFLTAGKVLGLAARRPSITDGTRVAARPRLPGALTAPLHIAARLREPTARRSACWSAR
jgi:hypothetical protein